MLNVANIRVGYRKEQLVLEDLGFSLAPGRILAILGPNGAGKTTLLRCINAIIKPRAGKVLVDNADIFHMSPEDIARRLGYVAQRNETGRMTVFDAVLLGRKPHIRLRTTKDDLSKAGAALEQLGLQHLALRHLNELSGGEVQKVCIARALAQEPRIFLLDEPTASLDLRNQMDVLHTVRSLVRGRRMGAVITMHDVNLALRFADAFLLLRDGRIAYHGQSDELTADMVQHVYGLAVELLWHRGFPVVIPTDPDCGEEHLERKHVFTGTSSEPLKSLAD